MILAASIAGLLLAAIPLAMFMGNLPLFALQLRRETVPSETKPQVSVLIPARDEQDSIGHSVAAALASADVEVEVVVLDDQSSDDTAEIVRRISESDPRVRCLSGATLPDGWNGKQYACKQLADAATHEQIVFLDADVRLRPDALARLIAHKRDTGVALLSAFPHQETGTVLEKWIIPLMHFILLGFLPLARMRDSAHPAYASGCGQLFLTSKQGYRQAGTHEAIRSSRHDGLKLPRAYRQSGQMTDVIDGTELAECRMYHSASEVIRGVLKNAIEGIANPRLIVPFSVLLIGGSVLPVITLLWSLNQSHAIAVAVSLLGVVAGHLPRAMAAVRFRQPLSGVLFHSLATTIFVALQWVALLNHLRGRQVAWRGRSDS